MLSELSHHGISSRFGKKRADLAHQPLDPIIVAAPWVAGGWAAYAGVRGLSRMARGRRRTSAG